METLKRKSKLWFPAWMAAARYITYNALLSYHLWHTTIKDSWPTLTSWDKVNVACVVALSALTALGAIMNGTWNKAKEQETKQ